MELIWQDVSFSYAQNGQRAILNHTDLSIEPGRVTLITGVSGCGKSTMLYLAAGIYPQNAGVLVGGRVLVRGEDPGAIAPERRAGIIGMIFQNPDLQFCLDTVKNELIFCLENLSVPPAEMEAIIDEALAFCGIAHLKERRLITLSGGEKQQAMLACIVALRPSVLLLDEPFANIDSVSARELALKLRQLHEERGVSIVAVDHHLDVWLDIADEIVVLEQGGAVARRGISPRALPAEELQALGVGAPGLRYQAQKPPKTPPEPPCVVQLKGVSVSQNGRSVLKDCGADFFKGRIHAIIGRSGSGKSTLFNVLCRILPYEGSILLAGRELKKTPRKKMSRAMGFVFQNPQDQFVTGSVFEEIARGLKKIMPETSAQEKTELILRESGLWRYRRFSPFMLSQGQQRKLAVAALFACDCGILVCDEPTYAQDWRSAAGVMDALQRQVLERGLTLIFSTHDLKLARDYADIIYELKEGRLHEVY